jgi:hypothetical protein
VIGPKPAVAVRLFGLVAAGAEPAALPLGNARLEVAQQLAAVVADEPGGRPPPAEIEAHRARVAAVFAHCAILPAPAGVVFRSIAVLRQWMDLHHVALLDGLAYVEGRAEARVYIRRAARTTEDHGTPRPATDWDREAAVLDNVAVQMFHELGREQPAWVLSTHATGAGVRTARSVPRAAETVVGTGAPTANGRDDALAPAVRGTTPLSRDDGEASASFLVDRSRWRAFVDAVALEGQRDPALEVRLTGPWPPYDFVRLQFGG